MKINCDEFEKSIRDEGLVLSKRTVTAICVAIKDNSNMMFAGVPGTGKTETAHAIAKVLFGGSRDDNFNNKFHRITAYQGLTRQDFFGDWDHKKQFLKVQAACSNKVCSADDVIDNVYNEEFFIPGPATNAIKTNGIFFVDEGNRGGEEFQNMMLEIAQEKQVTIPMMKSIRGKDGMPIVIVTYNEQDIAVSSFSDAFTRRFQRIPFTPPPLKDAIEIWEKRYGKNILEETHKIVKNAAGFGDKK